MNPRVILGILLIPLAVNGAALRLTSDGKTDYRIVIPAQPKGTDRYAAEILATYLKNRRTCNASTAGSKVRTVVPI